MNNKIRFFVFGLYVREYIDCEKKKTFSLVIWMKNRCLCELNLTNKYKNLNSHKFFGTYEQI